jgi:ABC-2 type transport system ATP-binding protein
MDFIRPDTGTVELFSSATQLSHTPVLRRRIGYLPEVANFPANLTVLDLLRFTAATCGVDKNRLQEDSHRLLTQFDLWQDRRRPLRSFSKGMQQRANFAIALINDPELLILDEPMSGLDPLGRKKIIDLIGELKDAGKTILFCSHILEDVDRLVDNVLLLHKGRKLFHGPPGELAREEGKATMAEAFVCRVKREEGHG